jgi:hypothetical protein
LVDFVLARVVILLSLAEESGESYVNMCIYVYSELILRHLI